MSSMSLTPSMFIWNYMYYSVLHLDVLHLYCRTNFGVFSLTDISQPTVPVSQRRCQGHRPHGDLRVEDGWDVQRPFDELRGWDHPMAGPAREVADLLGIVGSEAESWVFSWYPKHGWNLWNHWNPKCWSCCWNTIWAASELSDMGMIFEPGMKYYSHRAFIKKKQFPLHLNQYLSFSSKYLRYLHLHTLSHGQLHIT